MRIKIMIGREREEIKFEEFTKSIDAQVSSTE